MTWHPYPPPEVPWSAGRLVNNDRVSVPGLHGVVTAAVEGNVTNDFATMTHLFSWRRQGDRWARIVLTGESGICDYGEGYLRLLLWESQGKARLCFQTIDDNDTSGEGGDVEAVRAALLMRVLPTLEELNGLLVPLGMWVGK